MDKDPTNPHEGWVWTIEEIGGIACPLKKLVIDNLSPISCSYANDMNQILLHIEELAENLDQVAIQSTDLVGRDAIDPDQDDNHYGVDPNDCLPCDYE